MLESTVLALADRSGPFVVQRTRTHRTAQVLSRSRSQPAECPALQGEPSTIHEFRPPEPARFLSKLLVCRRTVHTLWAIRPPCTFRLKSEPASSCSWFLKDLRDCPPPSAGLSATSCQHLLLKHNITIFQRKLALRHAMQVLEKDATIEPLSKCTLTPLDSSHLSY